MRKLCCFPGLATVWVVLALSPSMAKAQEIPIERLVDWKFYNNTGWTYLNRGDYVKAEERFKMAIQEIRPYQVKDQRLLARSYSDLARALYHQARYAEAEPLAKWALSVREAHVEANPDAVFQSTYTLAMIHVAQSHFDQAEPLLRRALELQEETIGPGHVQTAATVDELAGVYTEQRKYKDADRSYKRAIAIHEQFDPDENLELAACLDHYVVLLKKMDAHGGSRYGCTREPRRFDITWRRRRNGPEPSDRIQGSRVSSETAGGFSTRPRIEDRCGDVTRRSRSVAVIVDGDDLTIGTHYRADIANVATAAIVAQVDRFRPGLPVIAAQSGADAVGLGADTINQAQPTVGKAHEAGRVPLARIRFGPGEAGPGPAVVVGREGFHPAPGRVLSPDRRHEVGRRDADRGRHDPITGRLGPDEGNEIPGESPIGRPAQNGRPSRPFAFDAVRNTRQSCGPLMTMSVRPMTPGWPNSGNV